MRRSDNRLRRFFYDIKHGLSERGFFCKARLNDLIGVKFQFQVIVGIGKSPDTFTFRKVITVSDHEVNIVISVFNQLFRKIVTGIVIVKCQKVCVYIIGKMIDKYGWNVVPDNAVLKIVCILGLACNKNDTGYISADELVYDLALQ